MAKQMLRLCFTFVGNSTENTGFWEFCKFYVIFPLKSDQNLSKTYKMTFGMQRSMCKKLTNFESLKVSKLITRGSSLIVQVL